MNKKVEKIMFDVLIVSKDRPSLLVRQIKRVKKNISYNKIIIVDSTEKLFSFNFGEDVEYYHTPNVKLGYARQIGLNAVSTDYIFMVDDDIGFKKGIDKELYNSLIKYGYGVFAMSPVIIFGVNEDINCVYKRKTKDTEGVSGGCCMIRKSIIDKIGGFNCNVHIGEDAELFYRAKRHGFKWIRKHDLFVNHSCTNVEFIFRPWRQRKGKMVAIAYGIESYHGLIIKKVRDVFMNLLSFIKHRNIRTTLFLISNNFVSILAHLRGIIGGKEYALHKKKIV